MVHPELGEDVLVGEQLLQAQDLRAMLEQSPVPDLIALNTAIGIAAPGVAGARVVFVQLPAAP